MKHFKPVQSTQEQFKPEQFRQHFPLICQHSLTDLSCEKHSPLIYFDNGATTQKPNCVIQTHTSFYQDINANVHRGSHRLSSQATVAFEQARETVKNFIHAKSIKEIIWTKGTTESINLIASSLGKKILTQSDEIILTVSEHHANIVPWQLIAEQTGAIVKVLPLDAVGKVDLIQLDTLLTNKTKIVCCAHISNVLGKKNPLIDIISKAKRVGAITVIDGAQAIAHFPVDVQALDCDFYVFSAHKMYGPTGVGVLYGKQALLESMPPYQTGGEMIKSVSFNTKTTFNVLPFKFEAGTPNIAGVIAFNQAIKFISQYDHGEIAEYEQLLTQYCYQALSQIPQVTFVVADMPDIPVLSFSVDGHHNHDLATSLDSYGIAVRSGHHCAMPLMAELNISGCVRVSMAAYNTLAEIDYFIACLLKIMNQEHDKPNIKITKTDEIESITIIEKFSKVKSWDARHREIMLLGKQLDRLDKNLRSEHTLISGCESLAWIDVIKHSAGVFYFKADSDAKIIRGLLVIVLAAFNNKTKEQIEAFDITSYFETLGLLQHLSPSRGNGVLAIVNKIIDLAHD
ncbi:SufS family cysteine desulfurase [Colwellia sp. MSW7]|jgi:cysteine desulfurase/selenocysteine lyase|uniref:cysteine desulfurase n=1 Tax=Colwellia maritima TaxID=2912588 RepID=A0ABS9X782_9GAMM|nr:SufS family cysteine desulfurase [Colwellia maritima]MCI2285326.1 SufS family cysteine desulfurase [Colwellia maritima]